MSEFNFPRPQCRMALRRLLAPAVALLSAILPAPAARVTLITHGFNATVEEWIIPLANRMAGYTSFWEGDASLYQLTLSTNAAGQFVTTAEFRDGTPASEGAGGNILVVFDWSNVAGKLVSFLEIYPAQHPVDQIAAAITPALMDPNLLPDLAGHALAEFPIHLIGHSRGGPLISEMTRLLGARGIWVDQVTMLDPHPCDPDDPLEAIGCPVLDPPPRIYANVTFADNYWQNLGTGLDLQGQPVSGAYNRQLTALPNGYGLNHSDTHLWYHGTVDFADPAFDGGTTLSTADRAVWYATGESNGYRAGFFYSLTGGGDRSTDETPAGPGTAAVREGLDGDRQALPANDGSWPNGIWISALSPASFEFNAEPGLAPRREQVAYPDGELLVAAAYQSGQSVLWQWFVDPDANALNDNEILLAEETLAATGTMDVSNIHRSLPVDRRLVDYGRYRLGARLVSAGSQMRRTVYAPQLIAVLAPLQLGLEPVGGDQGRLLLTGSSGYGAGVETTEDLRSWVPVVTNWFDTGSLGVPTIGELSLPLEPGRRFFRATYQRPDPSP